MQFVSIIAANFRKSDFSVDFPRNFPYLRSMNKTVERKRLTICSNGPCCNPAVESYNFCLSCEGKADAYQARIDGWRQTASQLPLAKARGLQDKPRLR